MPRKADTAPRRYSTILGLISLLLLLNKPSCCIFGFLGTLPHALAALRRVWFCRRSTFVMGALLHMYQFFSSLYLTIDDAWAHGREKRPRGTAAEVEVYSSTQTAEERARRLAYTMLPRGTMLREGEGCVEQMNGKVAVDAPVLCGIHNATQEAIIFWVATRWCAARLACVVFCVS